MDRRKFADHSHLKQYYFKPGVGGNPLGRGANAVKMINESTDHGKEIIDTMLDGMRQKKLWKVKVDSAKWLGDRLWGKVAEVLDGSGQNDKIFVFMVSLFKVFEKVGKDEQLRNKLLEAFEGTEITPFADALQDKRQEQESDSTSIKHDPEKSL